MTNITAKIRRDPFYSKALDHYGDEQALVRAGFFDDGLDEGVIETLADPRFLATPLYKLGRPRDKHARPVVLFSTGGFAPVHEGHLQMMEAAREKMIREGYDVIGGFLAPAHDAYVRNKGAGAERFPIHLRLESLEKAVLASDWLDIDPWMALYTPSDLNFTDVFRRLEDYLRLHVASPKPVSVAYVFGADNALFARTFFSRGACIVVNRPGHQPSFSGLSDDKVLMSTGRIHTAESNIDISSRQIRMGERAYERLLSAERLLSDGDAEDARTIFIRDDFDWASEPWRAAAGSAFSAAKDDFIGGLNKIFRSAYPEDVDILPVPSAEQEKWLKKNLAGKNVINMDCVTGRFGYPAHTSRLFHVSDRQRFSLGVVERPDAHAHLGNLPAGDYTLVDDDIATGGSMHALEKRLPSRVNVVDRVSLLRKWFAESFPGRTYNPLNILDMRDFLVGARMGGLVVEGFDGNRGRVPYLAPYVSLASRSSLPPALENSVSARIFDLNARFFHAIGDTLLLADADPSFRRIMLGVGFHPKMRLSALCAWHRDMLLKGMEKRV